MKARYFSSPNFLRFTKSPLSPLSHSQTLATTKVALNLILTRNTYPLSHTTTGTTTATTVAHHSSHNQASNRLIELGGGAATFVVFTYERGEAWHSGIYVTYNQDFFYWPISTKRNMKSFIMVIFLRTRHISGHVECLETGVFRSDLLTCFKLDPSAFNVLIENLDRDLLYAIRVEGKMDIESVSNHDEVKNAIMEKVLPPSAHATKASASKFLLSWLYQHEHEYENTGP